MLFLSRNLDCVASQQLGLADRIDQRTDAADRAFSNEINGAPRRFTLAGQSDPSSEIRLDARHH